jgi:hypothetical protein
MRLGIHSGTSAFEVNDTSEAGTYETLELFLTENGLMRHFEVLKEHAMDLDLLHEATSMELTTGVKLPLGDAKRIVKILGQASKQHRKDVCVLYLKAELSAMDSRTLVTTLVVASTTALIAASSPSELPITSTVKNSHEFLFCGIVLLSFLSMCASLYGILTLEFFGDW